MHEQGIHCFKAYVYQNTLQWAAYEWILCNTLLVQNCGDNRHILAPGVYVYSCQTDTIVYTMQETEVDPVLINNTYRNTDGYIQG